MATESSLLLKNATVLIHDSSDHVKAHHNTDILVTGSKIAEIGSNLSSAAARTIDCTGKIITSGFIDTHHHVWQTQLKGRHADHTLFDYVPTGNLQSYNYKPADIFYGQLTGCLEALDAGTTFILDHAHGAYTPEHANSAIAASIASGVRTVHAVATIYKMKTWTQDEIELSYDNQFEWILPLLMKYAPQKPLADRVTLGLGFDAFFLPKEAIIGIYDQVRKAGVKVITTHVAKNPCFGMSSTIELLDSYGLLGKDIVLSHATGINDSEKKTLLDKGVYISSTPETECQMAMGWPIALHPGVLGSIGVDCHTSNSSSILIQARMLLQMARQEVNLELMKQGKHPKTLRGTTEKTFNLATIEGARAVGMGEEIGSIKVGKKADLVIWDAEGSPGMLGAAEYDPLVAVLRHSDVRDVDTVIVGGIVRKEGGKLCDVEVPVDVEAPVLEGEGKTEKISWREIAARMRESAKVVQKRGEGCSIPKARDLAQGALQMPADAFGELQ